MRRRDAIETITIATGLRHHRANSYDHRRGSGSSARRTATRAKDSDRNDTCQILDTALAEGQLSMASTASG